MHTSQSIKLAAPFLNETQSLIWRAFIEREKKKRRKKQPCWEQAYTTPHRPAITLNTAWLDSRLLLPLIFVNENYSKSHSGKLKKRKKDSKKERKRPKKKKKKRPQLKPSQGMRMHSRSTQIQNFDYKSSGSARGGSISAATDGREPAVSKSHIETIDLQIMNICFCQQIKTHQFSCI